MKSNHSVFLSHLSKILASQFTPIHRGVSPVAFFIFVNVLTIHAQSYKNPNLPVEQRVADLLYRMTPEEKFWQLFMIPGDLSIGKENLKHGIFGFQISAEGKTADANQQLLNYSPGANAIETARKINEIQRFFIEESRLGIPIIPFDEALHGLIRKGATSFPQSIALAATFDTALMHRVSHAIALESKTRGIRQILSPVINIASDVRWGRVEETYGEDPFLQAEMAVAYVSEFEKLGVITTPKHLLANVGDGGRDSYPVHMNERFLREIHLPPFEAAFNRGGTLSVMTSYNSVDGQACSANDWILNQWLKKELGFKGFVISDANAVGGANVLHMTAKEYWESGADAINNGLDVIFQTSYDHYPLFIKAFENGAIPIEVIDAAVERILTAKFNLGLFENPYVDPAEAGIANGAPEHRTLAAEAARKSIVLLKNDNKVLPINHEVQRIVVIGADAVEARLGGYSGPGIDPVSILEGMENRIGQEGRKAGGPAPGLTRGQREGKKSQERGFEVLYERGCERTEEAFLVVPGEFLYYEDDGKRVLGLRGEYFNNVNCSGDPVLTRSDRQIRFQWTLFGPDNERVNNDFFSVRWTGKLKSPGQGVWGLGIEGNDGYRIWIDGELLLDRWIKSTRKLEMKPFRFDEGRVYDIRIEYHEPIGRTWFSLVWDYGVEDHSELSIRKAVDLAASSDLAIVVAGIEEGEFRDRALLNLPGRQEELIRRVAETGKPVVVVLIGGSAITMNRWYNDVDGIVMAWYPGEAGGEAIADILLGYVNPGGRLPITFPVSEAQLPLVYNHKPTGRGDDYVNLTGEPLFPFGFGLSYSTFAYESPVLEKPVIGVGESTIFSFTLSNTGEVEGDEVVQLYIRDDYSSVARPVLELKGFQRIRLKPGETHEVRFTLSPDLLTMLDKNLHQVIEPGTFSIMAGSSSADIRVRLSLDVQ